MTRDANADTAPQAAWGPLATVASVASGATHTIATALAGASDLAQEASLSMQRAMRMHLPAWGGRSSRAASQQIRDLGALDASAQGGWWDLVELGGVASSIGTVVHGSLRPRVRQCARCRIMLCDR